MKQLVNYVRLIRLDQWVKNGFLFLPLFFDQSLFEADPLLHTVMAFFAFAFASSSIYILNDYRDREADRFHPTKKNRPQASGKVGPKASLIVAIICVALSVALIYLIGSSSFGIILAIYTSINVGYSMGLKRVALLDIFLPASGYVLRVYAGGIVSDVQPSAWLTLMSFLLALFLIIAKRQDDMLLSDANGNQMRKSLSGYNLAFLHTSLSMIGGIIVVTYCMYTMSPETQERFSSPYLYLTVIYIIAGVLRYVQISLVEQNASSPSNLLYQDRFLQLVIVAWLVNLYLIIY